MTELKICKQREVTVYNDGLAETRQVPVVEEKPLTIFLNQSELATIVCSPHGLRELGVGFLVTEGFIQKPSDILRISLREEQGLLWIETSNPVPQTRSFLRRHIASCCGKSRAGLYFINDARQLKPIEADLQVDAQYLLNTINALEERSVTFRLTGGVHNAALADGDEILCMFEDIGRHNAVDKVIGYAFGHEIDPHDKCLILSGRVASEIVIKTVRAGFPLILSRSAPTELAVELAEDFNITVVGFARGQRFTVYSHVERVKF
ncbi:MAG: formate dehydrogenase accessory sulfurtransferase FdhD [Syntrophomonadaceae bacterium]|jgi:FdhD protein|nr:formate dehydrogenase accessory sulfurtransferase FdhD [Bacillota bacterium]NLM88962.1 formate dehydrogenase accessory sulfurtransferase FdhD [Syntrophomonadaceae bacterium]HQA49569.1 formate dehydrogenase accessory sulfurtransferase FdhD [Syntrophomonadaceae bacterium]HQD91075.1 formate dehydrogenase accessory sulfurtransferase FdhD [Syntrophomonadaceae bacterium]